MLLLLMLVPTGSVARWMQRGMSWQPISTVKRLNSTRITRLLRSLPDRVLPHGLFSRSSICGLSGCHAAALASLMLKLAVILPLLAAARQEGGFQLAWIVLKAVHRATIRLAGLGVLAEVILQAGLQLLQAVLVLHGRLLVVLPALHSLRP